MSGGWTLDGLLLWALAMLLRYNGLGSRSEGIVPQPFLPRSCRPLAGLTRALSICAVAAVLLTGCGLSNGPGTFFVDPGRYDVFRCNDLSTRWKALLDREKELRNLMDKASEGTGGTVIGTLAYRSDYESVLTEKKLVQREAAEKKCDLVPTFQSDQTIR